jgi:hypothetical protein
MFVEYETLRFVCEGGIDRTQPSDVEYGTLLAFDYYRERMGIEYSSTRGFHGGMVCITSSCIK